MHGRFVETKLEDELRDGARVVSHDFPIKGWTVAKPSYPPRFIVGLHRIYLYRLPQAYGMKKRTEGLGVDSLWCRALKFLRACK